MEISTFCKSMDDVCLLPPLFRCVTACIIEIPVLTWMSVGEGTEPSLYVVEWGACCPLFGLPDLILSASCATGKPRVSF